MLISCMTFVAAAQNNIDKAIAENLFSAEDAAAYEENKKSQYLFNFLSKEAVATLASLAVAGKDEYISNKIFAGAVEGRVKKQLKEICLVDQIYVKDGEMTVGKYIESVAKAEGCALAVKRFVRFETGEGIEKKEENFAEEVAKQMGM